MNAASRRPTGPVKKSSSNARQSLATAQRAGSQRRIWPAGRSACPPGPVLSIKSGSSAGIIFTYCYQCRSKSAGGGEQRRTTANNGEQRRTTANRSGRKQPRQRQPRLLGAHERLADQERVHVGRAHALDVGRREDAGLGDQQPVRRQIG